MNSGKYICVDENLYSYTDLIQRSYDVKIPLRPEDTSQLATIYPTSDEITLYALDINLDAYNYLSFVSASISEVYDKLKAQEGAFADVGILSVSPDDGVTVSIMDSHQIFSRQALSV